MDYSYEHGRFSFIRPYCVNIDSHFSFSLGSFILDGVTRMHIAVIWSITFCIKASVIFYGWAVTYGTIRLPVSVGVVKLSLTFRMSLQTDLLEHSLTSKKGNSGFRMFFWKMKSRCIHSRARMASLTARNLFYPMSIAHGETTWITEPLIP
jgi:hypothetical protein